MVTIVCNTGVLWKVVNASLATTGTNINVSSPMDQGKYICLNNNMVQEINYVLIKGIHIIIMLLLYIHIDYEPIQYLLPINETLENVPFNHGSKTPPPLCVVYSPINLTNFDIVLRSGEFFVNTFSSAYSVRQLHTLYIIQIVPNGNNYQIGQLQSNCRAVTQWESTLSKTYRISFDMESE